MNQEYVAQVQEALGLGFRREGKSMPDGTLLSLLQRYNAHPPVESKSGIDLQLAIGASKAPREIRVPHGLRSVMGCIKQVAGMDALPTILEQHARYHEWFSYAFPLERIRIAPGQIDVLQRGGNDPSGGNSLFDLPIVVAPPSRKHARALGLKPNYTMHDFLGVCATRTDLPIVPKPLSRITSKTHIRGTLGTPLHELLSQAIQLVPGGLGAEVGRRVYHQLGAWDQPVLRVGAPAPDVRFLALPHRYNVFVEKRPDDPQLHIHEAMQEQFLVAMRHGTRIATLQHLCMSAFLVRPTGAHHTRAFRIAVEAVTEDGELVVAQVFFDRIELESIPFSSAMDDSVVAYAMA